MPPTQSLRGIVHTDNQTAKIFTESLEEQFTIDRDPEHNIDWDEHVKNIHQVIVDSYTKKSIKPTYVTEI